MKVLITDTFPTIEVTTTQGVITLPDEYAGHWFVFFSHPGEFPIIDDEHRSISIQLGKLRADQAESVTARSVIVVDPHGVVRTILEYPKELGRNMDEIVRILNGLQLFDSSNLMAPANWPHNEITGDQVLIPPSVKLTAAQVDEQHVTQVSDWFRYRATA